MGAGFKYASRRRLDWLLGDRRLRLGLLFLLSAMERKRSAFAEPCLKLRTENASVAMKSDVADVRDCTNAKGKQLLTYVQSKSQSCGSVFVAGGSRERPS